ncbi:C1 family peptidase [Paenibacillus sp. 2TAF8]|uniref:C1 family peptidase n=1 Tax=Paenibacillus sp. 2TAF8 TaxID=3233020 RepID=UPI003F9D10ED
MSRVDDLMKTLKDVGATWTAEDNNFSRMSDQDRKKYLGANPPEGYEPNDNNTASNNTNAFNYPSQFDHRNINGRNYTTIPKDQDACKSCVAFGTISAIESTLMRQNDSSISNPDISEAHLYFCKGREVNIDCSTGWWPDAALNFFESGGIVEETWYPYPDGLSRKDCSGLSNAPNPLTYRLSSYSRITSTNAIKEWISTYGPVIGCFDVYDDFYNYSNGVYRHVTGEYSGGHCVAIVGYNEVERYWICKNSWFGERWGEQGFFRIAYGECRIDSWGNFGVSGVTVNRSLRKEHSYA